MLSRRPVARHNRGRIAELAAASGGFTSLAAVPGYCWDLDADVGWTLNGSNVSAWADQSPSAVHVTQAATALQPGRTAVNANFNGHASVDPIAVDSHLAASVSLSLRHVFIVANYPATTFSSFSTLMGDPPFTVPGKFIFRGQGTSADWRTSDDIAGTVLRDGILTDVALTTANTPHIHERVLDALHTSPGWVIGDETAAAGRQWTGGIARIVAYNLPVTGANLTGIRAHLKALYGTP